jgi:hypothetical protein
MLFIKNVRLPRRGVDASVYFGGSDGVCVIRVSSLMKYYIIHDKRAKPRKCLSSSSSSLRKLQYNIIIKRIIIYIYIYYIMYVCLCVRVYESIIWLAIGRIIVRYTYNSRSILVRFSGVCGERATKCYEPNEGHTCRPSSVVCRGQPVCKGPHVVWPRLHFYRRPNLNLNLALEFQTPATSTTRVMVRLYVLKRWNTTGQKRYHKI